MTAPVGAVPGLAHRFTIRAYVDPYRPIGRSGSSELVYIPITGGTVSGPDLQGEVLDGGGDWATFHDDGTVDVEARYQIRTDDGHVVDVLNTGIAHPHPDDPAETGYFATRPVFRVGEDGPRELERRVYLGWARSTDDWTEIDIFEVLDPQ